MLNLNQARTWHKAWNKQKNNTLVSPRLPRYVSPALQVGQTSRTTHVDKLTAVSTLRCQPTSEEMTATTKNKQPLSLYFPCKRLQPSLIWHFVLTKGAHHQSSNLCFTPGALPCHQGYSMEHRGQSLPLIRWGLSRRNTSTPIWPFFCRFSWRERQTAASMLIQERQHHKCTRSVRYYKGSTNTLKYVFS